MKAICIGLALIAPLTATDAAWAADLIDDGSGQARQRGGFAGARVRLPLGDTGEKAQVGLAVAGIERSRQTGESRLSTGLELGFARGMGLQLAVAGRAVPLNEIGRNGPGGRKAGVSTLGWVAIGAGVAALAYAAWFYKEMSEPHD